MANQHVAWSINSRNEVSLIYENYQGPQFSGDDQAVDISYSASGMVFILHHREGAEVLEYSDSVFPPQWQELVVALPGGITIRKIDAGPKNTLYMVLSDGSVAFIDKPKKGQASAEPKILEGVQDALQVSAAPDGLVWVVACDPAIGSVVRWLDPKKNEWTTVPELNNARRVTGTDKGKAYIIKSDGEIVLCDKKGDQKEVPSEFHATEISVGPDGTLWAIAQDGEPNGGLVFTTSNQGKKWGPVEGADAKLLDAGVLAST
jgi:hypothetical protein